MGFDQGKPKEKKKKKKGEKRGPQKVPAPKEYSKKKKIWIARSVLKPPSWNSVQVGGNTEAGGECQSLPVRRMEDWEYWFDKKLHKLITC